MTITAIVAFNIKRLRKLTGLTQVDLADRADFSVQYIKGLESGNRWLSDDAVARLSKAFKRPVFELFLSPKDPSLNPSLEVAFGVVSNAVNGLIRKGA